MKRHGNRYRRGVSLIESMIAAVILIIGFMGTMQLRYAVSLSARQGDLHATAARTCLMLTENWRGANNPNAFNPVTLTSSDNASLVIEASANGPDVPADFVKYGSYRIVVDDAYYYGVLSHKDVAVGLRALNVEVAWKQRGAGPTEYTDTDKTFTLASYVNN